MSCFTPGSKFCPRAYTGSVSTSSLKACAARCKGNTFCNHFAHGPGNKCRISLKCTEAKATKKAPAQRKGYFRKGNCGKKSDAKTDDKGTNANDGTKTGSGGGTKGSTGGGVGEGTVVDGTATVVDAGGDLTSAIKDMKVGGTIVIKGHHVLDGKELQSRKKCTVDAPCRLIGEGGATLDASVPLQLKWKKHTGGNRWSASVPRKIWQLWMGKKALTVARTPNVQQWTEEYWDKKKSMLWVSCSGADTWLKGEDPKFEGDDPSIPDAKDQNLKGCIMVINSGAWLSYARTITKHVGRKVWFDKLPKKLPKPASNNKANSVGLFFECGSLLDAPYEWSYTNASSGEGGLISVQLPDDETPVGKKFYGRVTDTLLNLEEAHNWQVENLNFFGGTIRLSSSRNVTVKGSSFLYPHHSKRVLGISVEPGRIEAANSVNLRFQNNVVRYSDGAMMAMRNSIGALIENNEIYMIDHAGIGNAGSTTLDALNSLDFVYRYNTMKYAGASDNVRYSALGAAPTVRVTTYMNHHSHLGCTQTDGATIQIAAGTGPWNNYVHHNWFVNTVRGGMRFDGGNAGVCGIVHSNVAMNTGAWGFRIKGDFHKVLANTDLSTSMDTTGPSVDKGPERMDSKANRHSWTRNNAANFGTYSAGWVGDKGKNWAPTDSRKLKDLLVDPEGFDFRPKDGENPLVDAGESVKSIQLCGQNSSWGHFYDGASTLPLDEKHVGDGPDIGAYERGADSYWIPGRREAVPTHPIPSAVGRSKTDLMWRPACGRFPDCLDDELAAIETYRIMAGCSGPESLKEIGRSHTNILRPKTWTWPFNKPCQWRVDTLLKSGDKREGQLWNYRAKWQTCTRKWIPCLATIVYPGVDKVNQAMVTGKNAAGASVEKHSIKGNGIYLLQCTVPKKYATSQGPVDGHWLEAKLNNIPEHAVFYDLPDAPTDWKITETTGTSDWVKAAVEQMAQAKIDKNEAPTGHPLPTTREYEKCTGSTSLEGFKVKDACLPGTISVATLKVFTEDHKDWSVRWNGGDKTPRHKGKREFVNKAGTYTFAMKAKKKKTMMIAHDGLKKPALGLTVCSA